MKKLRMGPDTLLYPMPAVLVGSIVEGRINFMTAAWCGIACRKPPCLALAVHRDRYTFKGIQEMGAFSVNVPSTAMAEKVDFCGIYSGRKKDKSEMFEVFYGVLDPVPLVKECPVNLECRLLHVFELGTHFLVIGEIVETHVTDTCMEDNVPDPAKVDPLIYSPKSRTYHRIGEAVGKAFQMGKQVEYRDEEPR